MEWRSLHPLATVDMLGYLPQFLSERDPRSAREQLDSGYQQGGGWTPLPGFILLSNGCLGYPGDPPTLPIAETRLRTETIRLYEHAWVAIIQDDGSVEVARMD
jgi:hypothetical protein